MSVARTETAVRTDFVPAPQPGIAPDEFRQVLSKFASGVTVVTVAYDGGFHGSTVASFCSLSLEPPLVLVCLDRRALTHALIAQEGHFVVNMLGEDGEHLSRHFASRTPDKFATVPYGLGVTGAPLLHDAIAALECRLVAQYPGGDHSIFVGEVLAASAADDAAPLLYFQRGYGRLA